VTTVLLPRHWRAYRRAGFPKCWRADSDTLVALPTQQPVDLVSFDRYGDFSLSFEWCLPPGGNSGLLYRVSEDSPESWQSGPEMQLVDDHGHPDGADAQRSCGALYDLMAPEPRLSPPAGVFHSARVVVRGSLVEHWLLGVRVLECDLDGRGLKAQIESSKFADFPLFARATQGHIVLQHHGTAAAFRRLRIET
jgi:hypothetical protein